MTTWLAVAAIVLAALSVVLFVLALRRLLSRQADVTAAMLRRYDDRLAGFTQTLNDALTAVQSARAPSPLELESDPEPMVRAISASCFQSPTRTSIGALKRSAICSPSSA